MKQNTNINYFLEYGISVNSNNILRSVYNDKYFHPKECLVSSGIVNQELTRAALGKPKQKKGSAAEYGHEVLERRGRRLGGLVRPLSPQLHVPLRSFTDRAEASTSEFDVRANQCA
jgi:hypothetical protein